MGRKKRKKSFDRVFNDNPTPSDVKWNEVVLAMEDKGYFLEHKGNGSSRTFKHKKTGKKHTIHEPHRKESVPQSQLNRMRRKIC